MTNGFSSWRLTLLSVGVFLCFAAVGTRLVYLHVIDRDDLLKFAIKARRDIMVEHAKRGAIKDARGNILAMSRSEIAVAVDPWALDEYLNSEPNPSKRAAKVSEESMKRLRMAAMLNLPAAAVETAFEKKMHNTHGSDGQPHVAKDRWVKLMEGVSESTFDQIEAMNVHGLTHERVYRRIYPGGELAAHLIGFLNREGAPVSGTENHLDFYLRGSDGWIESERDGARRELAQFRSKSVPANDGNDVVLTIDSVVQNIIEDELKVIADKFHPNFATIIASDPATGEIMGMANYPSFNLNEYSTAPLASQRNYAVTDVVEPGSTFKIVAASAALNEDLVTRFTSFDCGASTIDYKGRTIKLPRDDEPFETLNVAEIVAHSSNRGAAQLGMKLGEQRFYDYVRRFGFGQPTGWPLGGEVVGLLTPPEKWDGLTISRMPIGHSIAATPLQIHCAMSAVANGGELLRPQIIKEIRDSSGAVLRTFPIEARRRVMKPSTAAIMANLLTGVIREGTAHGFDIEGFDLAGKTGTTQKLVNGKYSTNHHVGSFVGFFPAGAPRVVLSVIVDDAHVPSEVAYGRTVALPSFRHIAEQLIQYLDIKPAQKSFFLLTGEQGGTP